MCPFANLIKQKKNHSQVRRPEFDRPVIFAGDFAKYVSLNKWHWTKRVNINYNIPSEGITRSVYGMRDEIRTKSNQNIS